MYARWVAIGLLFGAGACTAKKASAPEAPASSPSSQPASSASRPAGPAQVRAEAGRARLEGSEAGRLVLASIERHGGLKAWYDAGALRFVYDYNPKAGGRKRSVQTVDLLGARAYHTISHPVKGRFAYDGKQAWMQLEGDAKFPARFWALTPYYFVGMPFVLADDGVRLSLSDEDPGKAGLPKSTKAVRVEFEPGTGDAPDDYYVLYLDGTDHHLLGLRYVVSYAPFMKEGMQHTPEKLLLYEDVKPAGKLQIARTHRTFAFGEGKKGDQVTLALVEELEAGVPFEESELERPEGAAIDDGIGR